MASTKISISDHAFSLLQPIECILKKTTNLLSKVKFDGKSLTDSLGQLYQFNEKCLSHEIYNQGTLYRVFSMTFKGWIKKWFDAFTIKYIHSWEQFL